MSSELLSVCITCFYSGQNVMNTSVLIAPLLPITPLLQCMLEPPVTHVTALDYHLLFSSRSMIFT